MNWKRFGGIVFLLSLMLLVFDIGWNGLLFRSYWTETILTGKYWRPAGELNRLAPLGWSTMVVTLALQGYFFIRFGGGSGVCSGLRFGFWLALLWLPGTVGLYSVVDWPVKMLTIFGLQNFLHTLIAVTTFGWLYRGPVIDT